MPAAPIASAENTLSISTMPDPTEREKPDPSVSINALDALFTESGGNPKAPEEPLAEVKVEPKPKADDAPPEKKEVPATDDVLDDAVSRALADEKPPVVKEKPAPVVKEAITTEKDEFDGIELSGNFKPKTGESFNQLKTLARERVASVLKEKEALAKQVEELTAKASGPTLSKEIEAELKAGREFRAKLDVEADPAFLTYDKTIAENTEAIYAKLKATPGIDEKQLEAIKALGGPSEVDWEGPGIKLPSQLRRFIDSKLVENETLAEKKTKALADAKTNADQYLATRREEQTKGAEAQNKAVEKEIDLLLPKFGWLRELKPKEGASSEDVAAISVHNKMVVEVNQTLKDAVVDNSPAMRAILALGYASLLKTRADFSSFKAKAEATEKRLTSELEESKTLIARIKKSSTTRLRDTPAEDNAGKSKDVDISTPGVDALDRHLAAIQAAKE